MKRSLALIFLCALLVSCGAETKDNPNDSTESLSDNLSASTDITDPNTVSDLPDTDLGGYTFRIAAQDPTQISWSMNTFYVEQENGEILNDAIYRRNHSAMEVYNFNIAETITTDDPSTYIAKTVMANEDEYDAVLMRLDFASSVNTGTLYNLLELPNLNTEKLYWDQSFIRDNTLMGNLFNITGDILVSDDESTMVLTYNRPMAEDFSIENLYDVVRSGNWTVDKMLSCMKLVNEDIDNNGVWDTNDQYGLMFANNAAAAPYFGAFGEYLYQMDEKTGVPVFTGGSERAHTAFEKMNEILSDTTLAYDWSKISENTAAKLANMLNNKQVLFQSMVLSMVRRNYRDVELDFGILPLPKLDESQKEYSTIVNLVTPFISVPVTVSAPDTVGFILEDLAAASGEITETYYSACMESKYTRDTESYEMINLARQNLTYDMGFVYAWGGLSSKITGEIIVPNGNYASLLAQMQSAADTAMHKFVDELNG